jgi:hypothetical protein
MNPPVETVGFTRGSVSVAYAGARFQRAKEGFADCAEGAVSPAQAGSQSERVQNPDEAGVYGSCARYADRRRDSDERSQRPIEWLRLSIDRFRGGPTTGKHLVFTAAAPKQFREAMR